MINHKTKVYDTDELYRRLWKMLVGDFRSTLGPEYFREEEYVFDGGIKYFRQHDWTDRMLSKTYYFKTSYQLQSLFKRYSFKDDLYTASELEEMTLKKFEATQLRIATPFTRSTRLHLVLQKARKIAKRILGEYDEQEHYHLCKFGKRAAVGVPASQSYLDARLDRPLSGSPDHVRWFENNYLPGDPHLQRLVRMAKSEDQPSTSTCESLTLVNVPKSYKTLRSIMPNTTLGGLYSYGLGKMVERRLKNAGLNIKHLQKVHRRLAKRFSKTRTHVTADLSAASDSFIPQLVNMLLPRKWYRLFKLGRISRYTDTTGKEKSLTSFMTMGIGFTFQLQTLLFYCILRAIESLLKMEDCVISVYGDDLIYPSVMHPYVRSIFEEMNFLLNDDKTFVREDFRESCGGDYHCGCDVRPFQPEGQHQLLPGRQYVLLLYKSINGLLDRWDESEIRMALRYLYSEILRVDSTIYQVPPLFPAYAGVRVQQPRKDFALPWFEVKMNHNWQLVFGFYKLAARDRIVEKQYCYYWDNLRSKSVYKEEEELQEQEIFDPMKHLTDSQVLRWKRRRVRPWRSRLSGKRYNYVLEPFVAAKRPPGVIYQTGSTSGWTEEKFNF